MEIRSIENLRHVRKWRRSKIVLVERHDIYAWQLLSASENFFLFGLLLLVLSAAIELGRMLPRVLERIQLAGRDLEVSVVFLGVDEVNHRWSLILILLDWPRIVENIRLKVVWDDLDKYVLVLFNQSFQVLRLFTATKSAVLFENPKLALVFVNGFHDGIIIISFFFKKESWCPIVLNALLIKWADVQQFLNICVILRGHFLHDLGADFVLSHIE